MTGYPHVTRHQASQDHNLADQLSADLDASIERTPTIMENVVAAAIEERRSLTDEESSRLHEELSGMERPVITPEDALMMLSPDEEWFNVDSMEEGVQNHVEYHLGRPGECGGNCPAFQLLASG